MTPTPPDAVSHSDRVHNGDDNDDAKTMKTCINLACPIRARDLRRTVESSVLRFGEFHPRTLEMTMRWEGPVGIVALGETLIYILQRHLPKWYFTNIHPPAALNVNSSISPHDTTRNTVSGFYSLISLLVAFTPAEVKKALAVKDDLQKSHPSQMKQVTIRVVSLSTLDQATMRGTLRRIRRQAADRIARTVGERERERWAGEQLEDAAECTLGMSVHLLRCTQCILNVYSSTILMTTLNRQQKIINEPNTPRTLNTFLLTTLYYICSLRVCSPPTAASSGSTVLVRWVPVCPIRRSGALFERQDVPQTASGEHNTHHADMPCSP